MVARQRTQVQPHPWSSLPATGTVQSRARVTVKVLTVLTVKACVSWAIFTRPLSTNATPLVLRSREQEVNEGLTPPSTVQQVRERASR